MSECVVRMEMPVNCDKCDLRSGCKLYVDYSWSLSDCFPTRPKPNPLDRGCLIICSLPEGHGRLIDKDEVIESIRTEVTELFFNGLKGTPRPDGDLRFMWNRLEDEDFAPTIVPAESERRE